MEQHEKPCIKREMVIDRGKRSKTPNEVKPIKNIKFSRDSPVRNQVLHMEDNTHRGIARVN